MGCGESSICRRPLQRLPALHRSPRHIQRTHSQSQWRSVYVWMCAPPLRLLIQSYDSNESPPPSSSPSSPSSYSPGPSVSALSLICLVLSILLPSTLSSLLSHCSLNYTASNKINPLTTNDESPSILSPSAANSTMQLVSALIERYDRSTSSWVDPIP